MAEKSDAQSHYNGKKLQKRKNNNKTQELSENFMFIFNFFFFDDLLPSSWVLILV